MEIPDSVSDAELSTVEIIAMAMEGVPSQPACPGPLLVHADGAMECHGPGCPGAMVVFHSEDVVDPCRVHPEILTLHACLRCLTHTEGVELAEHTCTGEQIDHDDGTVECTAGDRCLGEAAIYMSGRSCRLTGPCPRNCQPTL
jgi:hypothetical protein